MPDEKEFSPEDLDDEQNEAKRINLDIDQHRDHLEKNNSELAEYFIAERESAYAQLHRSRELAELVKDEYDFFELSNGVKIFMDPKIQSRLEEKGGEGISYSLGTFWHMLEQDCNEDSVPNQALKLARELPPYYRNIASPEDFKANFPIVVLSLSETLNSLERHRSKIMVPFVTPSFLGIGGKNINFIVDQPYPFDDFRHELAHALQPDWFGHETHQYFAEAITEVVSQPSDYASAVRHSKMIRGLKELNSLGNNPLAGAIDGEGNINFSLYDALAQEIGLRGLHDEIDSGNPSEKLTLLSGLLYLHASFVDWYRKNVDQDLNFMDEPKEQEATRLAISFLTAESRSVGKKVARLEESILRADRSGEWEESDKLSKEHEVLENQDHSLASLLDFLCSPVIQMAFPASDPYMAEFTEKVTSSKLSDEEGREELEKIFRELKNETKRRIDTLGSRYLEFINRRQRQ